VFVVKCIVLIYFRQRAFVTTLKSDGNRPTTNEAFDFDFDFSEAATTRRADGHERNIRENDSLPSTAKRDPESNHWTNDVGQRQLSSGGSNSSTAERGYGFERYTIYSSLFL
jgi:hypothetical protein